MLKTVNRFALGLILALSASPFNANAKINIVTTLPSFADIAKNVGGDEVKVVSLTKGTQDPHFVDAKPDLMLVLNRADLLIRAGLGLEDGWLPPLQTGARNGKIQTGADGNLDASTVMQLLDVPKGALDRAQGDVHPGGNPHFMVDPRNGIVLAKAIADRLSKLEPSKASDFQKNAARYGDDLKSHIARWEAELKPLRGKPVVTYHKSWVYFSAWAGLNEVAYIEPKPGIPPSPDHVAALIPTLKQHGVRAILMEPFYPTGVAGDVARESGAKLLVLPVEVNGSPKVKTYMDVFENIVQTLKTLSGSAH